MKRLFVIVVAIGLLATVVLIAVMKHEKPPEAHPKDASVNLQAAEAAYKAGYAMEYSDKLTPHEKYAGALRYYRRALELNPNHAAAAMEKKQIEDVYRSMHKPIPK